MYQVPVYPSFYPHLLPEIITWSMLVRYPQNVASVYLKLQIKSVLISELKNDPDNARKHDAKNLKAIQGSLTNFGQQKPIVIDKDGIIIAGNGTFEAAKKLKWTHIDVVCSKLDKVTARAYALADNRTGELADWDDEALTSALKSLHEIDFDLSSIGFDEKFVQGYVRSSAKGKIEDDEVPDVQKNIHNVRQGQIWQLGEHRLMCSDSTNEFAVADLMDGCKADMVFTDPPYGISYQSNHQSKHKEFKNDDTILDFFSCALNNTKDDAAFYICGSHQTAHIWRELVDKNLTHKNIIVWKKNNWSMGDLKGAYACQYEIIFFAHKGRVELVGDRHRDVWEFDRDQPKNHPTQKPIELIEFALTNHKSKDVLDLFGGSGSTLIACEKTKRKCFMMEIDEHYCSVIIERWQQFTGFKANLISTK